VTCIFKCLFIQARIGSWLAQKWSAHEIKLYKYSPGIDGQIIGVDCVAEDTNQLGDADIEKLKHLPGVYEAYQGVNKMPLKVCTVLGKKAGISKQALAEFQNAPPSIKQMLDVLEKDHTTKWEDMLDSFLTAEIEGMVDPRNPEQPPTDGPNQALPGGPHPSIGLDLPTFASEKELSAKVKVVARVKCNGDKFLTLFEDDNSCFYMLCSEQDHVVKKGTKLGSPGSGKMLPQNLSLELGVIPFHVESDKTWVEVTQTAIEDDETAAKLKTGSLYMVAKDLIKQTAGKTISIPSVGKLLSRDAAHSQKHGFDFEHPKGTVGHKPIEYVLKADAANKPDKVKSAGNLFKALAHRKGVSGPVEWMFRCHFNSVLGKLTPTKPFLINSQDITLSKGVPMKVAWPKS
jgi:hypothetical protein